MLALARYPVPRWLVERRTWKALFVVAVVPSVYAHVVGAFVGDGSWSSRMEVERHPERARSWSDNPLVNQAAGALSAIWTSSAPPR